MASEAQSATGYGLLVDCGATTHIINEEGKFTTFDNTFNPEQHYIKLADGTMKNNVALKRGDAEVLLQDKRGRSVAVTLKRALYVPTYPQSILSVKAATTDGAKVTFEEGRNKLKTKDGTVFSMEVHGRLYYVKTCSTMGKKCWVDGCKRSYLTNKAVEQEQATKGAAITLHKFPRDDDLRARWLKNIIMDEEDDPSGKRYSCSLDFRDSDFNVMPKVHGGKQRKRRVEDAVPTNFSHGTAYPPCMQETPPLHKRSMPMARSPVQVAEAVSMEHKSTSLEDLKVKIKTEIEIFECMVEQQTQTNRWDSVKVEEQTQTIKCDLVKVEQQTQTNVYNSVKVEDQAQTNEDDSEIQGQSTRISAEEDNIDNIHKDRQENHPQLENGENNVLLNEVRETAVHDDVRDHDDSKNHRYPIRGRKTPKYLNDYITYTDDTDIFNTNVECYY
ncbi:uncharacterized protein LOC130921966 [Corythoichthys intestinalis]|uniref:uncharacterized protein LOC130921966 n=1 Tax=Corythoichthys intestinalis TaxID=161448 RepID=UPI0025A5C7A5|nr:uncharacterized protein LOC130921966 [Corythoichthys intestinalis]